MTCTSLPEWALHAGMWGVRDRLCEEGEGEKCFEWEVFQRDISGTKVVCVKGRLWSRGKGGFEDCFFTHERVLRSNLWDVASA